jgi:hypothetical protein
LNSTASEASGYDAPRSVVDAFRLRHAVGAEVAVEALRRWLRVGGQPAQLLRYAREFHNVERPIVGALQVLL